jgi:hypothetical protein
LVIFVHLEEETYMKIQSPRRQFLAQSGGVLLAAAVKPARAAQTAKPPAGTLSEAFLTRLPNMMEWANVPGLSIALIKDGKLAWARGFGVREANKQAPVDADTIFPAASLSKPVFTYAVLKMREEKLIDLGRPLVSYRGQEKEFPHPPRGTRGSRGTGNDPSAIKSRVNMVTNSKSLPVRPVFPVVIFFMKPITTDN